MRSNSSKKQNRSFHSQDHKRRPTPAGQPNLQEHLIPIDQRGRYNELRRMLRSFHALMQQGSTVYEEEYFPLLAELRNLEDGCGMSRRHGFPSGADPSSMGSIDALIGSIDHKARDSKCQETMDNLERMKQLRQKANLPTSLMHESISIYARRCSDS